LSKLTVTYKPKEPFFNNGIVNLYMFLENNHEDIDLKYSLEDNLFKLEMEERESEKIYFQILEKFFKSYKIVYQTKNDRWYFDEKKGDFILDKKWDVVGKSSGNDILSGVYLYKTIDELGITKEEIKNRFLNFCQGYGATLKGCEKDVTKIPDKRGRVIIAIDYDTATQNFTRYFVKENLLSMDSKIHSFEDGQRTFHAMLKQPKNYKIDKWNALIYWFGSRVQRFYNYSYFIYPNSSNLKALQKFKENLKINDSSIEIEDKNGKVKKIGTNIDFYTQLSKDGILNKNFYISKSEEEFEVKFFMYLFSIIYHIEEQYEKANKRRKVKKEELYKALQKISFVIYTDDGTFKTSFNEYTKTYYLIKFFEILKNYQKEEDKKEEKNLFEYLGEILVTFSLSQGKKEVNVIFKNWCRNMLNFSSLRKEFYLTSFNILKTDSKSFGKKLFEFEEVYLKNILKGKNMDIHKKAKILGDGIGYYCAELKDKDLLFKLRTIKNYKQLIAYFRDLKFSILKNEDKARFSKEFNETLNQILDEIETNWEITRDYMAIYAIDRYRAVNYAKNKEKGEK